jgi:hypothetical protein
MTDLVVGTAAQGGAYPQPRVLLAQARTEPPGCADHRGGDGHKWQKRVWRGFAAPKGMPPEIGAQYETAIKKI